MCKTGWTMRRLLAGLLLSAFLTGTGWAQERGVWVQVEAQPTLGQAQTRARAYAGALPDVAGFYLNTGWYGIALGPYAPADADALLRRLLAEGTIPGDSYIVDGGAFRQQFWPVGVAAPTAPQPLPGEEAAPEAGTAPDALSEPVAEPEPVPAQPDETRAEALASEELLTRPEKELLQIALQWAGYYDGAIDGAYGRGTRGAMEAWQAARGHEVTGVLTTGQRAALIAEYNAPLEGMDLQTVRDDATGIEIMIPTGVVEFAAYEPPFARFDPRQEGGPTVLLISQPGDRTRLFGLYEILQTLEAVPENGDRQRGDASFVIEGSDARVHSYVTARLEDGAIKGFGLIWPAGDEERRSRVLQMMQASFTTLPGVMDPAISQPGEDQSVDLISGLEVRQPRLSRSGFFLDDTGTVLTTAEAVASCEKITLDDVHPATVALVDPGLGIAVLRPDEPLAPRGTVAFQTGVPRLQAEVAVAGYPYGGVLSTPALTFGRLADIRGLNGEETLKRLDLVAQPGDAGGPVFDNGGAVLGMLMPRASDAAQVLPPEVSFVVDSDAILAALTQAGIGAATTDRIAFQPPEALTRQAMDVTVLVNCW